MYFGYDVIHSFIIGYLIKRFMVMLLNFSPPETRFTPIYDFGYVAMNFGWVYPEDSGEYICRATNLYGSDETRAIIKCSGKTGIVYESQLPKGMMSIERIREMESGWQRAPELLETETEKFKPCFVTKPEAVATSEGGSARFCCRVTGYPKPRVMWLINGHTVINVSRSFVFPLCSTCCLREAATS